MNRFGWLLALPVLLLASGCAGYRLGPVNGMAAGARSVEINPIVNQTVEPRLGEEVTAGLRRQLQRDGTYRLATHGEGDIQVSGVVNRYLRVEISLSPKDTLTVQDYRLEIRAQVTAVERGTGKVLLNQPVSGFTLIRVTNDITSTERQALPLLANDLAKNIVALLSEGTW